MPKMCLRPGLPPLAPRPLTLAYSPWSEFLDKSLRPNAFAGSRRRHEEACCRWASYDAAVWLQSALSLSITPMKLPATNMLPRVMRLISEEWQEIWDCCAGNKLHAVIPAVGVYKRKTSLSRHDSVLINRLRSQDCWYSLNTLLSLIGRVMTNLNVMFVSVLLQWNISWLSVLIYTMFGTTFCRHINVRSVWKCCITEHRWYYQGDPFL